MTDGPIPTAPDTESRAFSPSVAISNRMVRLVAAHVGRGPTRARTTFGANLVVVTLGDTMTRAERNLVDSGHGELVASARRILTIKMRDEAIAAVEEVVRRRVVGYMHDIDTEANMAIVAFVLDPAEETHSLSLG